LIQHFPVLHRELIVAARQRATYLSRAGSAAILLALLAAFHSIAARQPGFTGSHILNILSIIVFIECMLTGVRYTSDCLSEERREGTLGLLFLTDLSGWDIVAGKIAARALRAVYNLLAVFPILALTLFLGGVTGEQVAAISLTLFICTVFSLSVGIFISSRGVRERNVLLGTLLFLVGMSFVPIAVTKTAIHLFGFYGFVDFLPHFSPYHAFDEAGFGLRPRLLTTLLVLIAASIGLVSYAAWRIRHQFAEPITTTTVAPARLRKVAALPRSSLEPLTWLALRNSTRPSRIAGFVLLLIFFGVFSRVAVESRWNWAISIVFLGSYLLHAFYKFLLTAECCRQLNEDRRSGALELLLATPVSTARIVRAQIRATWRIWLPAAAALAFMNFLWMAAPMFNQDRMLSIMLPCSIILLVADTIVLPWRSVLQALSGEPYTQTVFKVFLRTNVPPLATIAFMLAFAIAARTPRYAENCFIVWTILCLIYSAVLIGHAKNRLRSFRLLAAGDARVRRNDRSTSSGQPRVLPILVRN
jgi:ABC-type transport system involved in cytochrome c biogenesis permease component